MSSIRAQFEHPTGWLGSVVGMLMSIKNRERSEWVLSQLAVAPGDRVLEIGFGPGMDIARTAAGGASVVGIDHSEVMLRQAFRRNADAIRAGRVDLRRGAMPTSRLPARRSTRRIRSTRTSSGRTSSARW